MSSFPYVPTSNVFNTADYNILDEGLTRDTADHLYLSLSGGTIGGNLDVLGTLSINSVPANLSFITGITAGTASASKALVLDASRNITNINTLRSFYLEAGNVPFGFSQRLISALDSTMTSSSQRSICLGRGYSTRDSAAITYNWQGINNVNSYLTFGLFGVDNILVCTGNNRVGIGNLTAPAFTLDVNGITQSKGLFLQPSTMNIGTHTGVTNVMFASNSNRHYGQRQIDSESYSLLSYSHGGNYSDMIIYKHQAGNQRLDIEANVFIVNSNSSDGVFNFNNQDVTKANFNSSGLRISGTAGGSGNNRNAVALDITAQNSITILTSGSQFTSANNTWQSFISNTSFLLSARFSAGLWLGAAGIIMTSDKRLKENIQPYKTDIEAFKRLNVCTYQWKKSGNFDLGMIAQETMEIMPHLVRTAPDESMDDGLIHSIDQTRLLYETVKQLQLALKKIDELEKKINS
jgi:hypothetical protein